ncbi:MAG: alpha/beta fold hydrolase [Phascolarctobacterium sp.]|nr:alpha/beta fold hydrolase [Phascolarctobacterium sp.]
MEIIKGAESYRLEGTNKKAVLLIHGYTGTPDEMRPLGDYLNEQGYTVLCERLPGHGTNVEDLKNTTAKDWFLTVYKACEELLSEFEDVYVCGLSMGGLLAIKIAATMPVKKAAFLATPIFLPDKRVKFYPILKYFIKELPKSKKNYGEMMKYNHSYNVLPTKPLGSMFDLLEEVKSKLLKRITIPSIVFQSKVEHTVVPESAQYIYDHLGTTKKELHWLYNSGHIITLDKERPQVFAEIHRFFQE